MQGKSRTVKTFDLPLIFFKIRTTRCQKSRRSWQRRARIALKDREDLTPAEKHEICCVWSRSDCSYVDSAAMSKLFKQAHNPQPHQTINARSCMRRSFDTDAKKPSFRGLAAANDDVFNPDYDTVFRRSQNVAYQCQSRPIYAVAEGAFPRFQGYISPRFHHGNDAPQLLYCDNHSNPTRLGEQTPSYAPAARPLQPKFSPYETPVKFGLNETVTANLRFWLTRNAASSDILRSSNDFDFENCGNWS